MNGEWGNGDRGSPAWTWNLRREALGSSFGDHGDHKRVTRGTDGMHFHELGLLVNERLNWV